MNKIILILLISIFAIGFGSLVQDDSCDCFRNAVARCGTRSALRGCRNRYVRRCFRRCQASNPQFVKKICKKSRGCNCTAHALAKCGSKETLGTIKCRNLHLKKCQIRCARVKPAIKGCECFLRSVKRCGAGAGRNSRRCRNRFVRRCSSRCLSARFLRVCDSTITKRRTVRKTDLPPPPTRRVFRENRTEKRRRDDIIIDKIPKRRIIQDTWKAPPVPPVLRREERRTFRKVDERFRKRRTRFLIDNPRKRICITSKNCNCRTQAKAKCGSKLGCYDNELIKCQQRCAASRRCYNLTCRRAGYNRCDVQVQTLCSAKYTDGKLLSSCITTQTQNCRNYEKCNCKRARRLYRIRGRCDLKAQLKCGALSGAGKCKCLADFRARCIVKFQKLRVRYIKKFFRCEEAARLLCEEEKCGNVEKCIEIEKKKCEPVCERESRKLCKDVTEGVCYNEEKKKCMRKWRREYCDKTVLVQCDFDRFCHATEQRNCVVPKCETNCDDKNACTNDFCDPILGCVHSKRGCDDSNKCTTDTCDPVKGCVHTQSVKCGTKKCQIGGCNPKTGVCEYKPRKDTKECAELQFCKKTTDCAVWGVQKKLNKQCKEAICDETSGFCVAVDKKDKSACSECSLTCKPQHKCEKTRCVKGETGELVCERTPRTCAKHAKKCFTASCDKVKGCVYKYQVSEVCKPGAQCELDCAKWGQTQNLRCKKPACDESLGACVLLPVPGCTDTEDDCKKVCQPRNSCETAKCEKQSTGVYNCKYESLKCDDGKECTNDVCVEGKCKHIPTKDCPQGPCVEDKQCAQWATKKSKCKEYFCEQKSGICRTRKVESELCSDKEICKKSCLPRTACETSKCVYNKSEKKYKCTHTQKVCDGAKKCYESSCNVNSGCVYTYKPSKECPEDGKCKVTADCLKFSQSRELKSQCKKAVCDEVLGACKIVDGDDSTCVTKKECDKVCPPRENKCESQKCVKKDGKVGCEVVSKNCNDNKKCTVDSCDSKTGLCVNTFKKSEECDQVCDKNLDCAAWGLKKNLALKCQYAYCDLKLGSCVAGIKRNCKPDKKFCEEKCPTKNACQESVCSYDQNKNFVCELAVKKCDDGKDCTKDYCDEKKGCVHEFVKSEKCPQKCITRTDCVDFEIKNKLPQKCQEAICDVSGTCRAIMVINKKCCPDGKLCSVEKCEKECKPSHSCEEARCIYDGKTHQFECQRLPIVCDDNKKCTKDSCDKEKGCVFTYVYSQKCKSNVCDKNVDCVEWAKEKKLRQSCQRAVCHKKLGTCVISKKKIEGCDQCVKTCKPRHACEKAKCKSDVKTGEFICVRKDIVCNDKKTCTKDSCDKKRGCVFEFKKSEICPAPCAKDLDCVAWGKTENLEDKCQIAVCDQESGSCKAIKGGKITDKCKKPEDECKSKDDCPPSKYGSSCCTENGVKKCCVNECFYDLDCDKRNPNPKEKWSYCTLREDTGKRVCTYKDKCKGNDDCDDKNPCTKDVCLKDYGKCQNTPRCVDNTECTENICIPSPDGKSYQCRNPIKSCTKDKNLLNKNFAQVQGRKDKQRWLGKCSHIDGCVTCVVNAQCDDNNGCTADSCEQQFCLHRPIHNEWCDPKLEGQPITFQSLERLRSQRILAGYDTAKLLRR